MPTTNSLLTTQIYNNCIYTKGLKREMKISYMKEYEWYVQYVYIYALLLTEYQLIDAHILDTEFSS
jgi:hypothetical protein